MFKYPNISAENVHDVLTGIAGMGAIAIGAIAVGYYIGKKFDERSERQKAAEDYQMHAAFEREHVMEPRQSFAERQAERDRAVCDMCDLSFSLMPEMPDSRAISAGVVVSNLFPNIEKPEES